MMTKKITWKNLLGQHHAKELLGNALAGKTLGHAYLFCGEQGAGTFQAAVELSMALLCSGKEETPCYTCESCRKVLHCAHPDFHVMTPVCLDKEHKGKDEKLNQDGWNFLSEAALARIDDPYASPRYGGVPSIPVEWVKEVNHSIMRGPVSADTVIVCIEGIDCMNKSSANAMLKILEEPPPGTLLILTTDRPQAVLPTIASRCQTVQFGWVPSEVIRKTVDGRFGASAPEAVRADAVRYCGGSPGRAFDLCENPPGAVADEAARLLEECQEADWTAIAARVDALARQGDYERNERLLMHLAFLVRSAFLRKTVPPETYFDENAPAPAGRLGGKATVAHPEAAEKCMAVLQDAIAGVRAHGNGAIVFVNCVLSLMEIINEQKQQIGGSHF